ncbi:MAG: PDR/VanB family oxidoreductase [Microbacterium sp.]|uniref:PDR/VanB family oxidoreductase n=1 Tax=Microbacterium sp. TaxID=51671 RepID=UPI00271979F9|nr:PDR/VanB family oxidoreductase [Microbacterium sp.]MDO8383596.1 PDR/VanB family oxidoreductase [Microbacterium sp.]
MNTSTATIELRIVARSVAARGIVVLDLEAEDAQPLPVWHPGAHVDLEIPGSSIIRQYSLCGDPADALRYRVAVLHEPAGRGGSDALHRLPQGSRLIARAIRNHFSFRPGDRCVFIAGGIGITPLLPMIAEASADGAEWELHYAGRSRTAMAFVDELEAQHPGLVHVYAADEGRRLNIPSLAHSLAPGAEVYGCGPARMLDDLTALAPAAAVHIERFTAEGLPVIETVEEEAFDVYFARSDVRVRIEPGQSILEVGESAGADVFGSCLEGICGTCETRVIDGVPAHRDSVLNGEDTGTMMVCVSRAACSLLTLDA